MPLYSARGKPIIVHAKLQVPGTEFQCISPSLQVNVKTRCNKHRYCYPIMVQAIVEWHTDLGCGVRPDGNLLDTEELKELVSISALGSEFSL